MKTQIFSFMLVGLFLPVKAMNQQPAEKSEERNSHAAVATANSIQIQSNESESYTIDYSNKKSNDSARISEGSASSDFVDLTRGLVAYYPFCGDTEDKSGNGHHGTAYGGVLTTSRCGTANSAYAFTGVNNVLSFSGFNIENPYMTVSARIKITNAGIDTALICTSSAFKVLLRVVDNKYKAEIYYKGLKLELKDDGGSFILDPQNPRFDFLVIAYDGAQIKFRINEVDIDSLNLDNSLLPSFPIIIKNDIVYSYRGVIDDIRIYNRLLSEREKYLINYDSFHTRPFISIDSVGNIGQDSAAVYFSVIFSREKDLFHIRICWDTIASPYYTNSPSVDYWTADNIITHLTNLKPGTTYFIEAYSGKECGEDSFPEISFTTLPAINYGSVSDVDGNAYKTVKIGEQTWMADNLKTTRYNDGAVIPHITDNATWVALNTPAYCWYYNDEATYKDTYGALYNNYIVNSGKICPIGWHIPSKTEWLQLENYIGGAEVAGGKMKECGTAHWESPNIGATDLYGFTALPAGFRYSTDGTYAGMGGNAFFWSSTTFNSSKAMGLQLHEDMLAVTNYVNNFDWGERTQGFSCRCIKDLTEQVNLQDGLIAYYPFNGNANDESGNGNNGVVQGATLTSDRFGSNNSSYYFDKNYAFIQLPNKVLNNLPNASISLWVYWNGERPSIIMAKQHDWVDSYYILGIGMYNIGGGVDVGDTGRIYFRVKNSSSTLVSNSLLKSDKWNHLAITIDQDLKLYINGILDAEISGSDFVLPDDLNATLTSLGLWLQDVRYSGVMNGNLDDIRFYNRVLKSTEIQALYNENEQNESISINTPTISAYRNRTFEVPVIANNVKSCNNTLAYQFDIDYDPQKIEYQNYTTAGTLSENGNIQVNPTTNKMSVAWAGSSPLSGSGALLKLQFKALETGSTTPVVSNFLLNTDTVWNIHNGIITIHPQYGDVDDNGYVQAYDAALALQYSIGMDPLPDVDPLPWENWRVQVANVDSVANISAYDASLILQYVAGMINSFPVQGQKKSAGALQAKVAVSVEDGYIVFRPIGELFGLNVKIEGNTEFLGTPQILTSGLLSASNISSGNYVVGLATAYPLAKNDIIMKIPITRVPVQAIILNMNVNTKEYQIELSLPTTLPEPLVKSVEIYPNPANTLLYFRNLLSDASFSIYDLQGRKLSDGEITNNQINIYELANGLYTIHIKDASKTVIKKFIKQ